MTDTAKLRSEVVAMANRGGKFPDRYDDGWNAAVAQVVSKLDAAAQKEAFDTLPDDYEAPH